MTEQELNERLAEWAGFIESDIKKYYYWEIGGIRLAKWEEPKTGMHIKLPAFTKNETFCFKYLIPKLKGYLLCDNGNNEHMAVAVNGKNEGSAFHKSAAMAICLAIKKMEGWE